MPFVRIAALTALGLVTVGCANKKPQAAANPAVTNVQPVTTQPQPIVITPVNPAPAPVVQPVIDPTPAPTPVSTASAGGTSYTVQKGDTISKIARAKYGDLSAVRKIKEANPNVDYNNIKPGQKLILP